MIFHLRNYFGEVFTLGIISVRFRENDFFTFGIFR
jgi:hypothetical protein